MELILRYNITKVSLLFIKFFIYKLTFKFLRGSYREGVDNQEQSHDWWMKWKNNPVSHHAGPSYTLMHPISSITHACPRLMFLSVAQSKAITSLICAFIHKM